MTGRTETIGSDQLAGWTLADGLRWSVAAIMVVGLGAAGAYLARDWTPVVAAPGVADEVILLDLAPALAEPEMAMPTAEVPALPEAPSEPELEPEPEPGPEPTIAAPADAAQPEAAVEPLAPDQERTPEPEPAIEPEPPSDPEPVADPEPLSVDPLAVPMPSTMSASLRGQRAKTPATPRQQVAATPRQPVAAAQAAVASAAGPSAADWQRQVLRKLDRNKVYPRAARRLQQEGVVQISFVIDAAGRISNVRVTRSSGSAALDAAAIETARRASPAPGRPTSMDQGSMSLAAAIRFSMR